MYSDAPYKRVWRSSCQCWSHRGWSTPANSARGAPCLARLPRPAKSSFLISDISIWIWGGAHHTSSKLRNWIVASLDSHWIMHGILLNNWPFMFTTKMSALASLPSWEKALVFIWTPRQTHYPQDLKRGHADTLQTPLVQNFPPFLVNRHFHILFVQFFQNSFSKKTTKRYKMWQFFMKICREINCKSWPL